MTKSLHTPAYEHFRALLVMARQSAGLTQAEVAARLGHPQSFIAKYEGGERRLDVVEFVHVCAALDVDPRTIIEKMRQKMNEA